MIKTRYTDIPEVSFDESSLPSNLRVLYPYAKEWCLYDPNEIEILSRSKSREEHQGFLDAFFELQDEIDQFLIERGNDAPVPDHVEIINLAFQAYDLLFTFSKEYKPSILNK